MNYTLCFISDDKRDAESFANVIASFKSSDIKLLVSIRHWTLRRRDAAKVLKSVMKQSSQLITGDLSRWLADHRFSRESSFYSRRPVAREKAFKYLASFATECDFRDALAVVKANEHYEVDSAVRCCKSRDSFLQDLYDRIERLLKLVKARNERIKEDWLPLLPSVLAGLVLEYAAYNFPLDHPVNHGYAHSEVLLVLS